MPHTRREPSWGEAFGAVHFARDGFAEVEELSAELREEILDPAVWSDLLSTYARTVGMAVALTDTEGRQSGTCHNPRPAWLVADKVMRTSGTYRAGACSFCLDSPVACQAVKKALNANQVEYVRDTSGLVHMAVPLILGRHRLGALIAGQVFDQYAEPLLLQRVAHRLGISPQDFWEQARLQPPVRGETLKIYGGLLCTLGGAFVRQRYAHILDRKLVQSNLRLTLLLDGIKGHALFTISDNGKVTSWNGGAERLFSYTEADVIGLDFTRFFTAEDIKAGVPAGLLSRASREGAVVDRGWQVRKDGTRFYFEGSLSTLGEGESREFGRLIYDVTERRGEEEALRHSQKLESIGVLASGIAHDFNNLLTTILGGLTFASASLPADHPASSSLAIAEQASERAADLTHQLLAYAGQGKFVVSRFDLSTLIRDMLKLLQTSIQRSVDLQISLAPNLPWIEADASQIQQVVMNLVINGAESIGVQGGPLRVSTGSTPVRREAEGIDGLEVWMEVRDSGSGMTEATKARIFDPFFTTKLTGRGLGLAAVSGIVRGHGGRMLVETVLNQGTTFRISFPAAETVVKAGAAMAAPVAQRETGTILIVEDDLALQGMARRILESAGYTVLCAENGLEGVDMFRQHANTIAAVLLDMTMPVMDGKEAFGRIREIRPDVAIIVSTGYSESTTQELFGNSTKVAFVQKPYTAARLVEQIRAIASRE
jgi:two-component system, chemotaxis family, CheB/CheR fusion protein